MACLVDIFLGQPLVHQSAMTGYQGRGALPKDMLLTSCHSLQVSETMVNRLDPKALPFFSPPHPLPSGFGRIHAL